MKKIIFTAAIALGSLYVHANTIQIASVAGMYATQDGYNEVGLDAIPGPVKSTVEKSFPNSKLEKAYVNDKKEYKLEISSGSNTFTVFTDASGNIIKK